MNLMALAMMILGVSVSTMSGILWVVGADAIPTSFDWLPYMDVMMLNPLMCVGAGGAMLALGLATRPARF